MWGSLELVLGGRSEIPKTKHKVDVMVKQALEASTHLPLLLALGLTTALLRLGVPNAPNIGVEGTSGIVEGLDKKRSNHHLGDRREVRRTWLQL